MVVVARSVPAGAAAEAAPGCAFGAGVVRKADAARVLHDGGSAGTGFGCCCARRCWRAMRSMWAMAGELGLNELTSRAVAQRMGLQDPQIWRALPKGRADILFLVAGDLQARQTDAVKAHEGLRKRGPRARVEAHLARMLAFDFDPGVRAWRRACSAQGWYWTREQS
jgi:hypothetical protein